MINNYIDEKKITKPCLIDTNFLETLIDKKRQVIIHQEPTLFDKILIKLKSNIYLFVEDNIIILITILILIILLVYRYYQYQYIKNNNDKNNEPYYGINYNSPYLDQYNTHEDKTKMEHFKNDISYKLGRKKKKHITINSQPSVSIIQQSDTNDNVDYDKLHQEQVPKLLHRINDRTLGNNQPNLDLLYNSSNYSGYQSWA